MEEQSMRDNALFEELDRKKSKRKKKMVRTIIALVASTAFLLTAAVIILQRQVRINFADNAENVSSYSVSLGSISTSVSGSGTLADVDLEEISVPAGVEIVELIAEAGSRISEGDVIATVDMASVMSAMASVQKQLASLDSELVSAGSDAVSSYISSGVQGRVKKIYADYSADVSRCIYENGALAVLSLDGYMALDIESDELEAGDSMIAIRADGSKLDAYVEKSINGMATLLVSDYDTDIGETLTVMDENGRELGCGELYIHSPLKISGISGTINGVYVYEDQMVYAGSTLFDLTDTEYTAGYEAILRQRQDAEETLQQLVKLYQEGALRAAFSGTVSSLDYDESAVESNAETLVATMSPDKSMSVSINVDESDIMSLELGQTAQISIDSVGDEIFSGTLTEINRTANSSSGVTRYTAVVTLDKSESMLAGMTASVVIRIRGIDNAVIIPVEALHQTSSASFVYTEYDEELGEFGGMVEVITGISNSSYVEIISGLNEGDTVWYSDDERSFGAGAMPGGMGQMPGGMDMGGMPQMPGGADFGANMGGGRPNFGGRPDGGFPG